MCDLRTEGTAGTALRGRLLIILKMIVVLLLMH